MGVEVKCKYLGNLNVENIHGPSDSIIETTAPVDNGGTGNLFSPTDLMAVSLGSCMLTIMGLMAEKEHIDLRGALVKVNKEMASNPRRISKLTADFTLPARLSDKERKKLEAAAKTCPVKHTLHPDTECILNFNYI